MSEKDLHNSPDGSINNNGIDVKSASHPNPTGIPDHRQEYARELAAMSPEEYLAFEKKVLRKMVSCSLV